MRNYNKFWRLVFEGGIAPSELGFDLTDLEYLEEANAAFDIYVERVNKAIHPEKGR